SNRMGSDEVSDYAGLFRRSPLLAGGLAFALISLTGIPPTAGFVAKIYIFNAAVEADLIWLVLIAVLNSVISAFYYLKLASVMFTREAVTDEPVPTSISVKLALTVS